MARRPVCAWRRPCWHVHEPPDAGTVGHPCLGNRRSQTVAMTIRALLLALAVACGHAAHFSNAPDAASAPVVRERDPFIAAIAIRNPYDRAVKVARLDSNCECSRLEIDDRFLLPGASTSLRLEVANRNRSGPQSVNVSVYVTDPEFEPIEVTARWNVRAAVQVDGIGPGMDPAVRPTDPAWQDVYRYVAKERPDELNRLRKRIRLSCPAEEVPAGGLAVSAIEYSGTLWRFAQMVQADGSILITATARDPEADIKEGTYDEKVVIRTNHPDKAAITLRFTVLIDRQAGQKGIDPMGMR